MIQIESVSVVAKLLNLLHPIKNRVHFSNSLFKMIDGSAA